jgi:CheY-like chemotaxis protein
MCIRDRSWKPAKHVHPIGIDPVQVDQILANLLVNARDAIDGIGKITIETSQAELDEDYCAAHPGCILGRYVMLTVSDSGCGMDEITLMYIFEPFFTTKGVGEGTGLGLATVYGIVKQNMGYINVYSEPGHGTTFRIYLPEYADEMTAQGKEISAAEPALHGHETILLVEDELDILDFGARMLERLGYTVIIASTPLEAISLAEKHHLEIHLLITDVVMPGMNGRELAVKLLSLYPNIKRLFTSGYTSDIIAHHGILEEGVNFIQKPFFMKDLSRKIREIMDN